MIFNIKAPCRYCGMLCDVNYTYLCESCIELKMRTLEMEAKRDKRMPRIQLVLVGIVMAGLFLSACEHSNSSSQYSGTGMLMPTGGDTNRPIHFQPLEGQQ